jgi:prevent-host-death family protein
MEARRRLGELLEGAFYRGDEVVIERAGKVMGVVIPEDEYKAIKNARDKFMEMVRENWEYNRDVPSEEIEAAIEEAIREVRAERAARRPAKAS